MKNIEFINAGAGSGKTYRLTNLLTSNIMEGKCQADQVILTTFTEKAAAEFKAKAREALIAKGMPEQANLLASAAIGTVHGVALQLIKKYWYLLGISPDIQVMPQADVDFFFNQALANIPTGEELSRLREITEQLSFAGDYGSTNYNRWKEDLENIRKKAITNRIADLDVSKNNSIAEIEQVFPVDKTISSEEVFNEEGLKNTIKVLHTYLQTERESNERGKKIAKCQTLLGKNNWKLPDYIDAQKFFTKTTAGQKRAVIAINDWLKKLSQLYATEGFVKHLLDYTTLVFDLAKRSLEEFSNYKKKNRLVDFDDMEDLFLKLLENQEGQREIAASFRQVYVDEFQDSSPVQVKIFTELSALAEKSYWVGDPKQAIFGFRGTDPELIHAVVERFEAKTDGLSVSNLEYSWRSRPSIVNLCNKVFSIALSNQVDQKYITLKTVRTDSELPSDDLHYPLQHWHAKDEKPRGGNDDLKWHHLAESLCGFINSGEVRVADKTLSKYDIEGENKTVTRALKPADIAILCRKREAAAALTKALRGFGIQVAGQQKDLHETTEASLLLAAINYLIDQDDQLAKATLVLLSGELASTEDLIDDRLAYLYNESAPTHPTWPEQGNGENSAKGNEYQLWSAYRNDWQKDCTILQRIQSLKGLIAGTSVPVMVAKLVVEGGLHDLVQRWDNPGQRIANLQALVQKAAEYDDRCLMLNIGPNLKGYIRFVEALEGDSTTQSAATGDEAVHVMTYHKSKGLEWPVVVLTELENDALEASSLINKSFFGVSLVGPSAIDPTNPFEGREIRLIPWPFGSIRTTVAEDIGNRIKETDRFETLKQKESNESNRLLYVGYTRARDVLITTSYRNKELKWINNALNGHQLPQFAKLEELGEGTHKLDMYDLGQVVLVKVDNFEIDLAYPEQEKTVEVFRKPLGSLFDNGTSNGQQQEAEQKYITPSKVNHNSPVKVVELVDFNFRIETGKAGNHSEGELGDCLHSIFSVYNPANDPAAFTETASASIRRHGLQGWLTHPGHITEAIGKLYAFLEKTYGPTIAVYHELPLQMEENGQIFRGEADMVWETREGLVLIDFKSYPGNKEHVMKPEHDKYTGRYAGQLFTYKRMLERAHPQKKQTMAVLVYYAVIGVVVKMEEPGK
jgi:ATP-dependent helicase/nuclease subunit A